MKKSILIALLASSILMAKSQSRTELFGFTYNSFGNSYLENPPAIGNLDDLQISYNSWEVFGLVPIVRKDNYKIISKVEYENTSFNYENNIASGNEIRPDQLHTLKLRFIYAQDLNDDWTIVTIINPTLSSDFEDGLSGDDLLFNGGLIFSRSLSERFSLGLGVMSSYAFGERRLLPVIDVKYESENEKFFAQARFPKLTVAYLVTPKFEVGLKAAQEGSQYNYKNIQTPGSLESDYIKFSATNFGPTVSYEIFKNIRLNSQLGMSTSRQFKVFDTGNEELGDLTPENNVFFNAGLSFGVPN